MCDIYVMCDSGIPLKIQTIWQHVAHVVGLEATLRLFCDPLSGWSAGFAFEVDITWDGAPSPTLWGQEGSDLPWQMWFPRDFPSSSS